MSTHMPDGRLDKKMVWYDQLLLGMCDIVLWAIKHIISIIMVIFIGVVITLIIRANPFQAGPTTSSAAVPVIAATPVAVDLLRQIEQHKAEIARLTGLLPTPTPAISPDPIVSQAVDGGITITFPEGYRGGMANVTGGPVQAGTCFAPDRIGKSFYFYLSNQGCQMFAPPGTNIEFLPSK